MADFTDQITSAAGTPKAVSTTSGSVTQQSIGDLVTADRYLASKAGAKKKSRGIRFTKLIGAPQVGIDPGPDINNPPLW